MEKIYGIFFSEDNTPGYKSRTIKNASVDVTIALATNFNSPGEVLTKSSVLKAGKLYIPIDVNSQEINEDLISDVCDKINSIDKNPVGVNIRSDRSSPKSLSNKLTNPNWYFKELFDVEGLYKANQSKVTAKHLRGDDALRYDMNLMCRLQIKKFRKNPELIDEINISGGLQFIKACSHIVGVKSSRWEGIGMDSNFIKVLAKSYEFISKELSKYKEYNGVSINIAGNGIYTMSGKFSQDQVDDVYRLIDNLTKSEKLKNRIDSIRTGGQTGFDESGAKAGAKLGIPTYVLAPLGWVFRDINGRDISDKKLFIDRFRI